MTHTPDSPEPVAGTPHSRPRRRGLRLGLLVAATLGSAVVAFLLLRSAPVVLPDPAPLSELPPSHVPVTIQVEPHHLIQALEAEVPQRLGSLDDRRSHPADSLARYAFVAEREPFQTEIRGDTAHLTTVIRYGAQVWYATPLGLDLTASCGTSNGTLLSGAPRALVAFSTPVGIEPDWTVRTALQVDRVAPVSADDRCTVSLLQFQMDVTEPILAAAELWLREQAAVLNAAASNLSLEGHLDAYSDQLGWPVPLGGLGWFTLNPEGIRPVSRADETMDPSAGLQASLLLTARPRLWLGASPPAGGAPVDLDMAAEVEPTAEGPTAVVIDTHADYLTLQDMAIDWLETGALEVMGRPVVVDDVRVSSAGGSRLRIAARVTQPVRGDFLITGTPIFDADSGELSLPDLEVRVLSGSVLVRGGTWMATTLFGGTLRDRARWLVRSEALQRWIPLEGAFIEQTFQDVRMEGSFGDLEIVAISVTESGIVLRGHTTAEARLVIGAP